MYDTRSFSDNSSIYAATSLAHTSWGGRRARYACFVASAALVSLLLCTMAWFSQIPRQIYVNAHPLACGSRYEWWQPVRADAPADVLTAINMANNR